MVTPTEVKTAERIKTVVKLNKNVIIQRTKEALIKTYPAVLLTILEYKKNKKAKMPTKQIREIMKEAKGNTAQANSITGLSIFFFLQSFLLYSDLLLLLIETKRSEFDSLPLFVNLRRGTGVFY